MYIANRAFGSLGKFSMFFIKSSKSFDLALEQKN